MEDDEKREEGKPEGKRAERDGVRWDRHGLRRRRGGVVLVEVGSGEVEGGRNEPSGMEGSRLATEIQTSQIVNSVGSGLTGEKKRYDCVFSLPEDNSRSTSSLPNILLHTATYIKIIMNLI